MNKLIISAVILMLTGLNPVGSQPQVGRESAGSELRKVRAAAEYRPSEIKTGDRVFCRLTVETELQLSDAQTVYTEPSEWFHISDIKVNYHSNEIQLWFIPLNPSEKTLPIVKTSNIEVSNIPVLINPVLSEGGALSPIEGRVLLPWTRLIFASFVASVLIIPLLIYFLVKRVFKPALSAVNRLSEKIRRTQLLKRLELLISDAGRYESSEYCSILSDTFKKYLHIATDIKAQFLTSEEIIKKTGTPASPLLLCDSVRFGTIPVREGQLRNAAADLFSYALSLESMEEKDG